MTLRPVAHVSVADAVEQQLSAAIVDGSFAHGRPLPAERQLAETLGVNRGAVREAIQRLAAAGLVQSRQGQGTIVLDYRREAGLDLLPSLLLQQGVVHGPAVRGLAELRACIGADAARLAASRLGEPQAGSLRAALDAYLGAGLGHRQRPALLLWEAIVEASDNLAYRLAFNSLRRCYEPILDLLGGLLAEEIEDQAGHLALVEAIAAGQPEQAERQARALLAKGSAALLDLAARLEAR
jgi:GntR family transcriptional regulator, transcriptional repressor for pyruvate dehydrogenase complex